MTTRSPRINNQRQATRTTMHPRMNFRDSPSLLPRILLVHSHRHGLLLFDFDGEDLAENGGGNVPFHKEMFLGFSDPARFRIEMDGSSRHFRVEVSLLDAKWQFKSALVGRLVRHVMHVIDAQHAI